MNTVERIRSVRNAMLCLAMAMSALGVSSDIANAQDSFDASRAWHTLTSSPVGALPPAPTIVRDDGFGAMSTLVVRTGVLGDRFAVGVGMRRQRVTMDWGIDVGIAAREEGCTTCAPKYFAGIDIERRMVERNLGSADDDRAAHLRVAANPSLGMLLDGFDVGISAALNVPVTLDVPAGDGMRAAVFVIPGAGLGYRIPMTPGMQPMIGGGIALGSAAGSWQMTVGARRVGFASIPYVNNATMLGVSLAVRGSGPRP